MKGWDAKNCEHLTEAEKRYAAKQLHLLPSAILGPPTGLLVGEMMGGGRSLPLMPSPRVNNHGTRLMDTARLTPGQYLGRLKRCTLYPTHVTEWDFVYAAERARALNKIIPKGTRVVLVGALVAYAFGIKGFFGTQPEEIDGAYFIAIPHPSGKDQVYDALVRTGVAGAIQWAANLLKAPTTPEKTDATTQR